MIRRKRLGHGQPHARILLLLGLIARLLICPCGAFGNATFVGSVDSSLELL